MNPSIATLKDWTQQARRIVFFGGAGVSTEIGGIIPIFDGHLH